MLISVIIPVWNDEKRISLCLDALYKQSIGIDNFEVIVVDNASTDGTAAILKAYPWVTVLYEPKAGSYVARNCAVDAAEGQYLAFTDSDCIPSLLWLENCLSLAKKNPKFGVIAGRIIFFQAEGTNVEQRAIDFETLFSMDQKINSQNGVSITANFFVLKDTIRQFDGFNEGLKSGGDHELSKRIFDAGREIIFCQDGYVTHPARNVAELLIKRRRVIGGSWDLDTSSIKSLKFIWLACKLLVKRTLQTIINNKFSISRKAALIGLLFQIFYTSITEIIRLLVGGVSARS